VSICACKISAKAALELLLFSFLQENKKRLVVKKEK
jgi:hypothetical protein